MYDVLIQGGTVVDPAQGIHEERDIGILHGRIAALDQRIPAAESKKTIDARGKIVTPGLIDLHTHVAEGVIGIGVAPDECGVHSGVTTVCDAGSTGYRNFQDFKGDVIAHATTDVFCFLNVVPDGLVAIPENWDLSAVNTRAMLNEIEKNREIIKGVKIRATGAAVQNFGLEGFALAKKVANEAQLPLMIHLGADPEELISDGEMNEFTRHMLGLLDDGDILTHIYTWKKGGVIKPDGTVFPELKEAMARGVLLDVANARTHYSVEIAKIGLDQGIVPFTVSTDITNVSIREYVFSVLVTMSKFLSIGFDFSSLVEMTTVNPATVLKETQNRGSIQLGMPADLSILELKEGDYLFYDGIDGQTFQGKRLIQPVLTIKAGVEIATESRFSMLSS